MNENGLYVVKEHKDDDPLTTNINFILDSCFEDCHNNYFQNFEYKCIR